MYFLQITQIREMKLRLKFRNLKLLRKLLAKPINDSKMSKILYVALF